MSNGLYFFFSASYIANMAQNTAIREHSIATWDMLNPLIITDIIEISTAAPERTQAINACFARLTGVLIFDSM
jgi:hypothetical protein